MRRFALPSALALFCFLCAGAQADGQRHRAQDPHIQAERLSRRLNLSSDQTAKVEPLLVDRRDRSAAIDNNTELSATQKEEQKRKVNRSFIQGVASILTPEQKAQWRSARKQRHGDTDQDTPKDR